MRNNYDLIVVGGGFAGLISAIVGARKGKKTAILAKGAGSLAIGGGVVDLLGYTFNKEPVNNPFEAMRNLPPNHPYSILGEKRLKDAISFFRSLSYENGFEFKSYEDTNSWLPTAIGTLRPTFLRTDSMNPDNLRSDHIVLIGISGLKDFYPNLMIKGLKTIPIYKNKSYSVINISPPFKEGYDLCALDIARQIDKAEGRQWFINSLMNKIPAGSSVIIPPILGTRPDLEAKSFVEKELSAKFMEISVMPPSVTGLRLRQMLLNEVKRLNIEYIDMAEVDRADIGGNKCQSIYTCGDKERKYTADTYIIATGGMLGGGLKAAPGKAWEQIFKIDLNAPQKQEDWSQERLFGEKQHLFGIMGVSVDAELNPMDKKGNKLLTNVKFAGKSIAGYDYTREKCGNGVALLTAYCTQDEN